MTDPANGWVEPKPYVPRPRPKTPPADIQRGPPTQEVAARWEASARDFDLRCPRGATMPEIVALWAQYSLRWAPAPKSHPLPLEEMFPLGLAVLQWHAVFQAAQRYCDRKERLGEGSNFPPYALILAIARKEAKRRKTHEWRRKQIHFLRVNGKLEREPGIDLEEVDFEEDEDNDESALG
jgi:hypothetical protein